MNVNSWCEYSVIFSVSQFSNHNRVSNHNNGHMVTCFIFTTFVFADKVVLDSVNYFNNKKKTTTTTTATVF